MALAIQDLRDRIAQQLAVLSPDWGESGYPLELLPFDARPEQHMVWAVSLPTTQAVRQDRQSSRGGAVERGTQALTTVRIGWTWWLRDNGAVEDLSDAYGAEADLVAALVAVDGDPGLRLLVQAFERRVVPAPAAGGGLAGALFIGTITCEVLHRLALE